jgi:hypothetical protein
MALGPYERTPLFDELGFHDATAPEASFRRAGHAYGTPRVAIGILESFQEMWSLVLRPLITPRSCANV